MTYDIADSARVLEKFIVWLCLVVDDELYVVVLSSTPTRDIRVKTPVPNLLD